MNDLTDDCEEYAVDTYPNFDHIDTVLATGFRHAVVEALANHTGDDDTEPTDIYAVHHMPSGREHRIELTDRLRRRIEKKGNGERG